MADCDLCGVSRPTLCPVKVKIDAYGSAFPTGNWKGLNEECLNACHEAGKTRTPASGTRCALCYTKDVPLFAATIHVPTFEPPNFREKTVSLCEECLSACDEAYERRQKELSHTDEEHHH